MLLVFLSKLFSYRSGSTQGSGILKHKPLNMFFNLANNSVSNEKAQPSPISREFNCNTLKNNKDFTETIKISQNVLSVLFTSKRFASYMTLGSFRTFLEIIAPA